MNVKNISEKLNLHVLSGHKGLEREVFKVYCCDLLSFAMGKAPADSVWITVMGNINVIAVASLADISCIVLVDGARADDDTVLRADIQGIPLLSSDMPAFECAKSIYDLLA